ncbi:hypothetical protein [Crenalkalicoccus roseus]|uniref:hypothetical protein n=1 Tax=Crenalkalicoccus roseus TaxID=1485588 RepID=UPI0010818F60|nr:hypothetical protein [Crenalkalicoccus roseus]
MSARGERRWIVLGQDGRHVTLGRATSPSAEEIAAASKAMESQGLTGWIATLDGDYWGRGRVTLAPVQTIGAAATLDWPPAVAGFLEARQRARRAA